MPLSQTGTSAVSETADTQRRSMASPDTVRIVPDSGTGELTGTLGTLEIDNLDGEHPYVLDYELP